MLRYVPQITGPVSGALIRGVFLRHMSKIKKMGVWTPFGVLGTHFSPFCLKCTSTALFGLTRMLVIILQFKFTASLLATFARASYHFPPARSFFELITGYEAQSTHAESLSKFTLALNISRLNLFNPLFIISWNFSPSSPGALADLHIC